MEDIRDKLSKLDILLCGLAYTSRTETLEDYFKDKVKSLTVIAISSCFLKENLSSCKIYTHGILKREFKLLNFRIKDYKWYRQPLVLVVFITNWLLIGLTVIKLRKKFDLFIGISQSFAFIGAIFKKIGLVREVLYYCIDYYIPPAKLDFNTLFVRSINIIDRFTVRNADYIWDLNTKISEYRQKIGKIKKGSYSNTIVPLGYSRHLRRFKPINEINRWDIGFVGTITANQGLRLLVESMPDILGEFPQIRVTIIGQGPFLGELKNIISKEGLDRYFNLSGFIKDTDQMLNILSGCAIGVALYNDFSDDKNIICADPGKIKLYALCGLPIITTKFCSLAEEIGRNKAGIIIDCKKEDLHNSISYLMGSDDRLREFKQNSFNLGEHFIADSIFSDALASLI